MTLEDLKQLLRSSGSDFYIVNNDRGIVQINVLVEEEDEDDS